LVAIRWAATAILVIGFLMAPLAQFGAVEANPFGFTPSPGIYVYSPTPEQIYWEPNVEISFKIILDSDLAQIDSFFYSLDNKASSPLTFSRNTEDHFVNDVKYTVNTILVSKTLANLTDSIHRIAVFAHYSDGTIKSILYRSITVDTTLPNPYAPLTPVIVSPVNQTTYNTAEVPLTYTIEKEILWSYYSLDSIDNSDLKYFEGNITLHSISEGQHKLRLYVTANPTPEVDPRYEQVNYHSTGQTIIFYVDTTAPKVSNLSIKNTDSADRLLCFTFDEEASWVGYSLDNQANVTVTDYAVLGNLSFGSHNVTVYAEDSAGNMGASETLFFTIEDPFPTSLVIASVVPVTVVLVGIGLIVYLIKRK
jgi:hypothetical protein